MTIKIPMSSPDLTDLERQAVQNVLNTTMLSMGHWVLDFERSFCDLTGAKHAVAVSSGTAGLHLCIRAAGIGLDDLVVTTPFSFVASTNVMLYENAVPVFVDVNPKTGNIDPQLAIQAVLGRGWHCEHHPVDQSPLDGPCGMVEQLDPSRFEGYGHKIGRLGYPSRRCAHVEAI